MPFSAKSGVSFPSGRFFDGLRWSPSKNDSMTAQKPLYTGGVCNLVKHFATASTPTIPFGIGGQPTQGSTMYPDRLAVYLPNGHSIAFEFDAQGTPTRIDINDDQTLSHKAANGSLTGIFREWVAGMNAIRGCGLQDAEKPLKNVKNVIQQMQSSSPRALVMP